MSELEIKNTEVIDLEYESKKKKLHPAPEEEGDEAHLKRKKPTPKTPKENQENKENSEEGEIRPQEEEVTKALQKSATRSRSRSNLKKNKSKSALKSKSKSKSRSRARDPSTTEEEKVSSEAASDVSASAYTLRPRKNLDYSKMSPEEKKSGTGTNEEQQEDHSDVSFRVEEAKDEGHDEMAETEKMQVDEVVPQEANGLPQVDQPSDKQEEAAETELQKALSSDSENEEHSPLDLEEAKKELQELKEENIETEKEKYEDFKKEEEDSIKLQAETGEVAETKEDPSKEELIPANESEVAKESSAPAEEEMKENSSN